MLLYQSEVAQFTACCPSGLVFRQSVLLALFRLFVQVESKFLV
jgi:hypothetical protein